jgi:hypothetical protein
MRGALSGANRIESVRYELVMNVPVVLLSGKAVAFYGSYTDARQSAANVAPDADVWYTERNGDCITLLAPQGTPRDHLPSEAMGYWVFEWIRPEDEFSHGRVAK